MTTVYEYNGNELFTDTDDTYTVEEIQTHYGQHFAELNQATYTVVPPEEEGKPRKVIFAKKVGTKGNNQTKSKETARELIIHEVKVERLRQEAKWGPQNHHPVYWVGILAEELGEVAKFAIEDGPWNQYRTKLVQLAAVAVAALEAMLNNGEPIK